MGESSNRTVEGRAQERRAPLTVNVEAVEKVPPRTSTLYDAI
jgi:hypothetical protein